MSRSGFSDSRCSSSAQTTLATSSLIGVPMKTMLSFSRRENRSVDRDTSPGCPCSMTLGCVTLSMRAAG